VKELVTEIAKALVDIPDEVTVKEIAGRLDISLSSIETYKTRAADKLSIKGRAEIVRYASAQGWLASV